jgi:predicted ester cyclase
MSTESNKAVIRRGFEEGINQGNLSVFDELVAPTYVNHTFPAPVTGPDAMKGAVQAFKTGFPDMQITLEDVLAEGDRVATRGYFNGIPATGKAIKVNYSDVWRLEDGKPVENWVQIDMMGLLQQLGVIPTPEGQ